MRILRKLLPNRAPTRDEFAGLVLRELERAGISDAVYDNPTFTIEIGGRENVIFLDNAYANYCNADRQERSAALSRMTSVLHAGGAETPSDFPSVRPFLMPVIRDASYSSLVRLDLMSKKVDVSKLDGPTRPLFGSLVVGFAYDTEHSIQFVNRTTFDRWAVSFDDALLEAIDNLRKKTPMNSMNEEIPGLYRSQFGDSYDSARILLTDLIYRLGVYGEPVAFVPNRNQLWVTGSRDEPALRALLEIAEEAHFQPYPISPDLFILRDGNWEVYSPGNTSLLTLATSLKRRRRSVDYAQQKESLDLIHNMDGVDIFVTSYLVIKKEDGSQYSACVWSKGIDSLLPESDYIYFFVDEETKDYVSVTWEQARSIVGVLMKEELEFVPKRYRVSVFPNEQQLTALRKFM